MCITRYRPWLFAATLLVTSAAVQEAAASTATVGSTSGKPQITQTINSSQLTTLKGTVPLKTSRTTDIGSMGTTEVIPSMTLMLKRSADMQKSFDDFLASLSNPTSPNFHKWLTAKQVGEQFGPNKQDVAAVKDWLSSQGLGVTSISADGMRIRFSGSVGSVQKAFGTSLHRFTVNGKTHFANILEQKLPTALTGVVSGVASLTDFFPEPLVKNVQAVKRNSKGQWVSAGGPKSDFNFVFNGETFFDFVPADFATIYNVNPLWNLSTPIRGAGQTVAVLERTNVQDEDITTFRKTFLPSDSAGVFTQVHPVLDPTDTSCGDPGTNGDEGEAALDAEWAGAAAPDANVTLASCADNGADFGPFLAAQNLLESASAPPPIISLSYGECELISAAVGDIDEAASLWSTAAAEGTTVFVSSGDAGSAGCDQNQSASTFGIAVNGLGSTPYNVSVGGTDFNDLKNTSKYWAAGNGALGESALSYIPEQTWNDSCASAQVDAAIGATDPVSACNSDRGSEFLSTAGGSGGPSYVWNQPVWQQGIAGLPQNVTRAIPDVSLFAANGIYGHALIFCMSDGSEGGTPCNYLDPTDSIYNSAGGTSFAAPAMAGVQALINQQAAASHGNMGPMLYGLARKQYGTGVSPGIGCNDTDTGANCIFHDVTVGDIDVPCFAGTGDCYTKPGDSFGVVSDGGTQSLATAWKTSKGYDYATGLGSVNVTNLVNAVAVQDAHSKIIPRTWDMYGYAGSGNPGVGLNSVSDGHSSLILVKGTTGETNLLWMNGGTVLSTNDWTPGVLDNGQVIDGLQPGDQVKAIPYDIFGGSLTGQNVMESDNPVAHTMNLAVYSYGWYNFRFPYPAGWELVGAGVVDASGVSQQIWRNSSTGQLGYWSITCSGSIFFGRLNNVDCERTIGNTISAAAGYTPRLADINGDGYIDIVWTGPNHDIYYWINDGQGNYAKTYGGTFPAGWVLEGAGEVTGSGKTDLIWTNATTHQMGWWVMDGTTVTDKQIRSVTAGYSFATVEDFDADGLADIVWTNPTGDAYVWQSTGSGWNSQRLSDSAGNIFEIPADFTVQKNRLQGVTQVVSLSPPVTTSQVALSNSH